MENEQYNLVLKKVSSDIARVQASSDVLAQWPISSVEAMYYLGPFIVPATISQIKNWPSDKESLLKSKLLPGRLSNLIFFLLEKNSKKKMGPMHPILLRKIVETIFQIRELDTTNLSYLKTWIPSEFTLEKSSIEFDSRKLVFMLDNLTELKNPIFRTFGVQFFASESLVYRYYYNIGLGYEVLLVSPIENFEVDFFEHVISPENLKKSKVYKVLNGNLENTNPEELLVDISKAISEESNKEFNREFVFDTTIKSLNISVPTEAKGFITTPFPKEILEFYIKTCTLPQSILSEEIYKVLAGD